MKKVTINGKEYEITKDYKNGFEKEETENKLTEYFDDFDYILGDWAYGKLRLKGFCDKQNKKYKPINDINSVEDYIKDNCAFECRHFILKKIH
ncbi:MAG: YutD family protein [Bacilli bacterium]|nr:YutD family protein [Bacilli bacterium]